MARWAYTPELLSSSLCSPGAPVLVLALACLCLGRQEPQACGLGCLDKEEERRDLMASWGAQDRALLWHEDTGAGNEENMRGTRCANLEPPR